MGMQFVCGLVLAVDDAMVKISDSLAAASETQSSRSGTNIPGIGGSIASMSEVMRKVMHCSFVHNNLRYMR